jgi:hypothetical protein
MSIISEEQTRSGEAGVDDRAGHRPDIPRTEAIPSASTPQSRVAWHRRLQHHVSVERTGCDSISTVNEYVALTDYESVLPS